MWNGNDWNDGVTYSENIVVHVPFQPEPIRGREEFRAFHEALHTAFPDWRTTVDEAIVEGNQIAMRWTISGTHLGPFMGLPPTGRSYTVHEAVFGRMGPDGLVEEFWFYVDELGIARQLGLAPSGQPPKVLIHALLFFRRLRRRLAPSAA